MAGRFEVYPDPWGTWQFRLRSAAGDVVAVNAFGRHPFDSSADAAQGCELARAAAASATIEKEQ